MGSDPHQVVVPDHLGGVRFDKGLAQLTDLSRSHARRLIEAGQARLEREPEARARTSLEPGDVIRYEIIDDSGPHPERIDFGVLYEDAHLAVIDKPAGIVTHPGPGNTDGTLVSGLLHRWPQVRGVGDHPRWGIVHRLDRETSGALAVALTEPARLALSDAIRAREVSRQYLCLVHGTFGSTIGTIDAPIDRVRSRRVVQAGGRPSITHYRRKAAWERPELTLLEVTLETGRTHQIRVHLESIDRHVVGDRVYGRPAPGPIDPGRVWLHARRLGFDHPETGLEVRCEADLAMDLESSLAALGEPSWGDLDI